MPAVETPSATSFQPMRIALFSAIPRGFIARCSEVQLRMAALRLYDLRAFSELSGRAAHGLLLLALAGRWLVPSITVVVGHPDLLGDSRSTNYAEVKV
jgi:hypothetical protein